MKYDITLSFYDHDRVLKCMAVSPVLDFEEAKRTYAQLVGIGTEEDVYGNEGMSWNGALTGFRPNPLVPNESYIGVELRPARDRLDYSEQEGDS